MELVTALRACLHRPETHQEECRIIRLTKDRNFADLHRDRVAVKTKRTWIVDRGKTPSPLRQDNLVRIIDRVDAVRAHTRPTGFEISLARLNEKGSSVLSPIESGLSAVTLLNAKLIEKLSAVSSNLISEVAGEVLQGHTSPIEHLPAPSMDHGIGIEGSNENDSHFPLRQALCTRNLRVVALCTRFQRRINGCTTEILIGYALQGDVLSMTANSVLPPVRLGENLAGLRDHHTDLGGGSLAIRLDN